MPGNWGFNIASQLAWVNLLLEIIQEAIIQPLFYCIGNTILDKSETINKVKTGITVSFAIYLIFSLVIVIFANQLTRMMAQNTETINATA